MVDPVKRQTARSARAATEQDLARLHAAGEIDAASTLLLRHYGPEILGWLVATTRSLQDAGDIYSDLSLDLWRGLPGFRASSSFRTWAYCLARNARFRFYRGQRADPECPVSQIPESLSALVEQNRSRISTLRLPGLDEAFARLRAEVLEPEEQDLLILHLDREMSWEEVAQVITPTQLTGAELGRAANRAKQRYHRCKERLREAAAAAGLLRSQR